jgi:hypothetical protein
MGLADARHRASQAAATVARALDWPDELVSQLRELGKAYSAARSQAPRDLPKDEAIEVLIDRLSAWWQWPVAGGLVPKRLRTGSA